VIKGFRIQDEDSLRLLAVTVRRPRPLLLDAYKQGQVGGTGTAFDWRLAREAQKYGRIILAGGLTPENVAQAIAIALPAAVDAAGGTEPPRAKKAPPSCGRFLRL